MIRVLYIIIVVLLFSTLPTEAQSEELSINSLDFGVWELLEIPYDSMLCKDIIVYKDTLFVSTKNKGILYSTNDGDKWEVLNKDLEDKGTKPYELYKNENIFASILEGNYGFIISPDGGKTWIKGSFLWPPYTQNPPINDGLVFEDKFILATDRGLMYTADFGDSWVHYFGGDLDSGELASLIIFDNLDDEINFYTWTLKGLLISKDMCDTWQKLLAFDKMSINNVIALIKIEKGVIFGYDKSLNMVKSTDIGESWNYVGESLVNLNKNIDIINYENNLIAAVAGGVAVSHDGGKTKEEYYLKFKTPEGVPYYFYKIAIKGQYIIAATEMGLLRAKLSDLGIIKSTVEAEIERNYLYTYPPYPNPAKSEVKVLFYWDINLPMTTDDVSIYDITGKKIDAIGNISLVKQESHYGNIIWDCSSAQPGIYLINIKHGTEEKAVKVVVE